MTTPQTDSLPPAVAELGAIASESAEGALTATSTTVPVKCLELDVALWAQALADLARARPTSCWEGTSPRDEEDGPPATEELLALLPDGAEPVVSQENNSGGRLLAIVDDAAIQVLASQERVNVVVAASGHAAARHLGEQVIGKVHCPAEDAPGDLPIGVWSRSDDVIDMNRVVISVPRWSDIQVNYPRTTRDQLERLMRHECDGEDARGGRLILFHGPPGTGKSYAIRALMNEWRDWCRPTLVVDPEVALHDYKYLHQLLAPCPRSRLRRGPRWRIVIAEDADRFIRAEHRSPDNGALDKLLNATDGILAQCSRTLFLLTTNIELASVNAALARPGRCLAVVAFDAFGPIEARKWLGESVSAPNGSATLAQLYELKRGESPSSGHSKVTYGQYL